MLKDKTPSDQIANTITDVGGKIYDSGKNIAAHQANQAINYLIPGLDTMSNEDAKIALQRKASKINAVLQDLADDPEVQQIIQESGEAFAKLTSELMDAIEEPVAELTERGINMASQLAENTGKTLTKTGVDLVMSVLGEIPGVGGLVDLGVTALVGFNGLAKNIMIGSENITKMVTVANELTGDALKPIEDSLSVFSDLEKKAQGIYSRIDDKLNTLGEQYRVPETPKPEEVDERYNQTTPPPSYKENEYKHDDRYKQTPPPSPKPIPYRDSRNY